MSTPNIKPLKVLLALLLLNAILALVALVFPEEGIKIGDSFSLKFPSISSVFNPEEEKVVSVDSVLQNVVPVIDSLPEQTDSSEQNIKDKISSEIKSSINYDSATGKLKNLVSRSIQFPDSTQSALDYFLKALVDESPSEVIRVLHYGDSQLEGDRVSDYLRNRLQMLFGGEGPGIILPLEPTAAWRRTVKVTHSRNISKEAIYKPGMHPKDKKYGIGDCCILNQRRNQGFDRVRYSL